MDLGAFSLDPGPLWPPSGEPDIWPPGAGHLTQGPRHLGHQEEEHGPGPGHRLAAQHRGDKAHVPVR